MPEAKRTKIPNLSNTNFSFKMNDIPLLLKVSIAPAFAFAVLLGLAFYANFGLGSASTSVRSIVEVDMRLSRQLHEANNNFKQLDGDLYRLITFYAADSEAVDLIAGVEELKGQIESLAVSLVSIKEEFGDQIDVTELESVESDLTKYGEAIDVVTSMLEIDFSSAVSFIEPFRANAAKVSGVFHNLSETAQKNSDYQARDILTDVAEMQTSFLYGTGISGLLVAVLSWFIGRMTSQSIREIAGATGKLAGGDKSVDVEVLARKDELGTVVEALAQFRQQMIENDRLQQEQQEMQKRSEAEERRRVEEERGQEEQQRLKAEERREAAETERKATMRKLADAFDQSVTSVVKVVQNSAEDLDNSAMGVQTRASSNSSLCASLSSDAEEVSHGMQTVATATEELTSSITEIARQMETSSLEISGTVVQTKETNATVMELAATADRIGEVVNIINDIAAQTNLLALNATIEAARAGDAGKGFAVVASEVKGLAGQTGKATEEIATQIESVQTVTQSVVDAMELIALKIDKVSEISATVAAAVEEQTGATGEIARTVSLANNKITTLSESSGELTVSAKENGESADQLLAAVATLKKEFSQLEHETAGFVQNIRSD